MEQIFASARIYLMVIVFFSSCLLGLNSKVSLPILALRSIIITGIVGVFSHFFFNYMISVLKSAMPEEKEQAGENTDQDTSKNIDTGNKK